METSPASDRSDAELLASARDGDPLALEQLLVRHQPRIYRFGMKMCRDPEDASDVLQETLLALARGVRGFRGAASLSTWLYSVTRSFCIKKRRKSRFAPPLEESLEAVPHEESHAVRGPAPTPEEDLAGREMALVLDRAIAGLDPPQREVLLLRDVEGLSAAEVAEILGLRVAAVKSRLHRARLAVRNALGPALGAAADGPAPDCPDILATFSRHLEGEIGPEVCARLEAHVASCAHCRARCDSLKKTLALCRGSAAPEVPEDVQRAVRLALSRFLASAPR